MYISKQAPFIAIGALLLGTSQFAAATGASAAVAHAKPFGFSKLTPAQKRHVSGLMSIELGGANLRTAKTARASFVPFARPGCGGNLGNNVKVNQNCLNLADSNQAVLVDLDV